MNNTQKGLLQLIRCGITGQAEQLPEGFELESIRELAAAHQLVGLVYEGCVVCGMDKTDPQMRAVFQKYYGLTLRHERQMAALNRLFAAFEQEGIDYLPMKGVILKQMYPAPAARVMGDADVLIRQEQYDRIRPIMQQLGYEEEPEYYHELPWKSKDLYVELHRSVVPSYHAVEYAYFEHVWDRAVHKQGHCYAMSPEDEYLFNFEHYAKHYRGGGIGIRQLIDLWLCAKQPQQPDGEKLRQGLEKLNMLQFYDYTCQLLKVWFEDAQSDERTDFMTDYIYASGSWGQIENRLTAKSMMDAKRDGSVRQLRSRKIRQMIFPPLDMMKSRYPVLEKAPVLLPVMWPVRWVTAALFRHKNVESYNKMLGYADAKQISSFEESLRYVGLEYQVEQE